MITPEMIYHFLIQNGFSYVAEKSVFVLNAVVIHAELVADILREHQLKSLEPFGRILVLAHYGFTLAPLPVPGPDKPEHIWAFVLPLDEKHQFSAFLFNVLTDEAYYKGTMENLKDAFKQRSWIQ
jgi:hypothetical protein